MKELPGGLDLHCGSPLNSHSLRHLRLHFFSTSELVFASSIHRERLKTRQFNSLLILLLFAVVQLPFAFT